MKSMLKKVTAMLIAVMLVVAGSTPLVADAAGSTVVIHVKDDAEWGSMNVYNWGDAGETAGVWPGTAMESEGDGWYTHTFTTDVSLNLVFSAEGGSPQSTNIEGLAKETGECWITVGGGEEEENEFAVSGQVAVLYTEAEEGWPSTSADAEVEDIAVEDTAVDETPATGETSPIMPIALLGCGALVVVFAILNKKQKKEK